MALYTDRAGWAFHTPKAGGRVDRAQLTQVGRALARLGIEHILAYSPQARGRSERLNRTLQDRLVNELRLAGITMREAANAYLRGGFTPAYNEEFNRPPADPASAFVPLGGADLAHVLCHEEDRTVGQDNAVVLEGVGPPAHQAARAADLRRAARHRAAASRWAAHGVARPPVLRALRRPGAAAAPRPRGVPGRPRPQNRPTQLAQERRSHPRPYSSTPRNRSQGVTLPASRLFGSSSP
jgi:hypothetical protein